MSLETYCKLANILKKHLADVNADIK